MKYLKEWIFYVGFLHFVNNFSDIIFGREIWTGRFLTLWFPLLCVFMFPLIEKYNKKIEK